MSLYLPSEPDKIFPLLNYISFVESGEAMCVEILQIYLISVCCFIRASAASKGTNANIDKFDKKTHLAGK